MNHQSLIAWMWLVLFRLIIVLSLGLLVAPKMAAYFIALSRMFDRALR